MSKIVSRRFKKQESMEANPAYPYRVDGKSTTCPGIMTTLDPTLSQTVQERGGERSKREPKHKQKRRNENEQRLRRNLAFVQSLHGLRGR